MGGREKTPILPPEGEEIPLGVRLRARRWFLGIWIENLAEDVGGYSPSRITQIENLNIRPSEELLDTLCSKLAIRKEDLLSAPRNVIDYWIEVGKNRTRKGRHSKLEEFTYHGTRLMNFFPEDVNDILNEEYKQLLAARKKERTTRKDE